MPEPEPPLTPTRLSARFYRVAAAAATAAAFAAAAVADPLAALGFAVAVVALEACGRAVERDELGAGRPPAGTKTTRHEFGVEVRVGRDDRP